MAAKEHAKLSASAAHRWLNCTAAPTLEAQFPDTVSPEAEEGTLAHALAEAKAAEAFLDEDSTKARAAIMADELYQPEMEEYTDEYISILKDKAVGYPSYPRIAIEEKIDLSAFVPEGFGTCDAIMIGGDTITVIDFKYGKGVPVSSVHNPQMMLYALGAYETYQMLFDIKTIEMMIVQPRISNNSVWSCTAEELLAFGEEVKVKAARAFSGEGEYSPGDWCRFCKARSTCRARADNEVRMAFEEGYKTDPALLSNDEIARYIKMGEDISSWLSDLTAYALNECMAGREVKGYKAVHGRSSRDFRDMDEAFKTLMENGIDEAMLYERKPMSVAKLEKAIGKKLFGELVGSEVITTPGKPTLAPESDKREAINTIEQAFKEEV